MVRPPEAPQQTWISRHGPTLAALVAISSLLGFLFVVLSGLFESKAHAQEVYSAQAAALAAAKMDCELNLERSMGRIRLEMEQTRGSVTRLEANISRIDATVLRIADKLGVPAPVPGFVPLAAPPRQP